MGLGKAGKERNKFGNCVQTFDWDCGVIIKQEIWEEGEMCVDGYVAAFPWQYIVLLKL